MTSLGVVTNLRRVPPLRVLILGLLQPRWRDGGWRFCSAWRFQSLMSATGACLVTCALELLKLSRSAASCAACWTLTGDAACCFGVLLVISRDSPYNSRSLPCLNLRIPSCIVVLTALLALLLLLDLLIGKRTNCSNSIWSCRIGHESKSCLFSLVGCSGGFRASFVASMTDKKVSVTLCSSLYLMLVVSGCRKVGGCGCSSARKVRPSCHSDS